MKTIIASEHNQGIFLQVKFKDDVRTAKKLFELKKLVKLFPSVKIKRLIRSVAKKKLDQLIIKAFETDPGYDRFNFHSCFLIKCPHDTELGNLINSLSENNNIQIVDQEYSSEIPPSLPSNKFQLFIPNISESAPGGINSSFAHSIKGGDGYGKIKFVDIEQGWSLNHPAIKIKTLPFFGKNLDVFKEHGTAVLGVIMMKSDGNGRCGITPRVKGHIISQWRPDGSFNTVDALITAISRLNYGDILLLEAQGYDRSSVKKFWPVEINQFIFQAIRLATALGITVIEPAGNGDSFLKMGNNLDNFIRNKKKTLNRKSASFKDSGAVIVAASSASIPNSRMYYSNYGNRVDCFAWGEKVSTTGYFADTSSDGIDNYTTKFCGTSSASAIIAGAAIAIQSISEANFGYRLSPKQMRRLLNNPSYNTISVNGKKDKIGVMPDLKRIILDGLKLNQTIARKQKVFV